MRENNKLFWFSIPAVAALLMLIGLAWFLGLPWAANNYGFAVPGPGGLPYRIFYGGRTYVNHATCAGADWCHSASQPGGSQACWSVRDLQQRNAWPLAKIGTIPVLFASAYPLMAPFSSVVSQPTIMLTFVPLDNGCYVPYALSGGP